MVVEINSVEYEAWHEIGHAVTCLHLGGEVEFVELLGDAHPGGGARARCTPAPGTRDSVLCGGFAAEFILNRDGYLAPVPENEWVQMVFKNATIDREGFIGRKMSEGEFTEEEDKAFSNHAILQVVPILRLYRKEMATLAAELAAQGKVEGARLKEVLAAAKLAKSLRRQP